MGLRDDLMGRKLATEDVFVPEWQLTITLREMSGAERDSFEQAVAEDRSEGDPVVNLRAKLLVRSITDGGVRVFSDNEAHLLGAKSAKALNRLFEVAARLSGIGKDAAEQAEKNSVPTPGGASSSGSPSSLGEAYPNSSAPSVPPS